MEQDYIEDTKQLADSQTEEAVGMTLIEVEPGVWGYVGEHAEPNSKDYESIGSISGYWI